MKYKCSPKGVCSRQIEFELDGELLKNIRFEGGCSGNLQGLARLAEGLPAGELVRRLKGIRCGNKKTSCPDQLVKAVEKVYMKMPK